MLETLYIKSKVDIGIYFSRALNLTSKMALKKNILANYIGTGFSALAPIIALPFYLEAVGTKQWGLISFVTVLQSLLGMLDAGMTQALTREVADRSHDRTNGKRRIASLLVGFEKIYWVFAIFAALIIILFANVITNHWIQLDGLSSNLGFVAVYGAAALFVVQFPVSVYRSILSGSEDQVNLNIISTAGVLLRHVGGVFVVLIWPTVKAYLIWHVCAMFLETMVTSKVAWDSVGIRRSETDWNVIEMRQTFILSAGLSFGVMAGVLTLQIDKLILSLLLPIEQLGFYVIASSVALGALRLVSPIFSAVLPRLVSLRNDSIALRQFNKKFALLILLMVILGTIFFGIIGRNILEIWLNNPTVVATIYPLVFLLLIGSGMNAFYGIGYLNWIAHGQIKKVFIVNITALVVSTPLLFLLISKYGLIGATFGWVFLNFIGLLMSLGWLRHDKDKVITRANN